MWMAEDAARELPNLPLEDALQLVHLYFERGSPKYERALRWLRRYLDEDSVTLRQFAEVTATLAGKDPDCTVIASRIQTLPLRRRTAAKYGAGVQRGTPGRARP